MEGQVCRLQNNQGESLGRMNVELAAKRLQRKAEKTFILLNYRGDYCIQVDLLAIIKA
uniref:Uncharacterized protein n=1 Tax=Peronospora matthiolae TaxID=2874970 RepID=A0AAV1T184_9STRA